MASDATGLRDYKGAAVAATLSTGISNAATTFSISPTTNWPTGSNGSFTIVIDQGTSSEEAMLCSAQSAGVLTVTTRGYDGTTATAHNLGAPVLHVPVALDFAEANQIANTHSQTSKTTPVGADEMPLFDSAATFGLKKLTMTNLAAFLASLTQTLTNKDLTDSTNKFNWPSVAGKNAIINGSMDIWQRGTISGSAGYQTADRWYENATASTTFAQETTVVPTGSKYSFKMTANATAYMVIQQAIETNNSLQFAGQLVTVSAQVQASVTTGMTVNAQYSTSVDNPASGAWTAIAATSGGTGNAVSGNFTRISGVYLIPASAKSILFYITTTSTVASGVIVYIGQCQLELGSTATTFSRAGGSIGGELALCQRYYYQTPVGVKIPGSYYTTTLCYGTFKLPVTMRAAPTIVGTTTGAAVYVTGSGNPASAVVADVVTVDTAGLAFTTGASTAGYGGYTTIGTATTFSAEL